MLTNTQKKILEDKIYEIAKKRINEWENRKGDGGKSSIKDKDLGLISGTKKNTILKQIDDDTVNKAQIAYKMDGTENASPEEQAASRSIFYKKLHNKKNDNGVPYEFNAKELNKIASIIGDQGN